MKLPKSFVAIDLSEKVPDAFERTNNGATHAKEESKASDEDRGRSDERKEDATPKNSIPIADPEGNVVPPTLEKQISPTELPPPALDL